MVTYTYVGVGPEHIVAFILSITFVDRVVDLALMTWRAWTAPFMPAAWQ
jgi:hypothetical protein